MSSWWAGLSWRQVLLFGFTLYAVVCISIILWNEHKRLQSERRTPSIWERRR